MLAKNANRNSIRSSEQSMCERFYSFILSVGIVIVAVQPVLPFYSNTFIYFMQNGMQKLLLEQRTYKTWKVHTPCTYTFRYPTPPSPQKFIALRIFGNEFPHDFQNQLTGFLNLYRGIFTESRVVNIAVRENWAPTRSRENERYRLRWNARTVCRFLEIHTISRPAALILYVQ